MEEANMAVHELVHARKIHTSRPRNLPKNCARGEDQSAYKILYNFNMTKPKPVEFVGSALDDLRAFPQDARCATRSRSSNRPGAEQVEAMSKQRYASVWDAIEDTPEAAENMKLRSSLMTALREHINRSGMSQAQAAKLLGVTQPRVSDLMRGKISLFGLDALVNMAAAAGLHIEMRVLETV